jgi:hypothetical protein
MSITGIIGQTIMVHGRDWTIWAEAPGVGRFHAFRRVDGEPTKWIVVKRKATGGMGRDSWMEA